MSINCVSLFIEYSILSGMRRSRPAAMLSAPASLCRPISLLLANWTQFTASAQLKLKPLLIQVSG